VRVRKEKGGHLRFDYIKTEMIPRLLKSGQFQEIRVPWSLMSSAEAESFAQQRISVQVDGDSREAIISLE